ncbi:SPFH domain-containing protein [Flavobacterium caeni]|uniref:Membrane protease subunit, stomatin/prohibitin family, contains C-terminal Zn-ribbon domain n=1 Tax=Flavobacterium caeni TaxID=490189 RepID=A0A1G5KLM6_9FLAO|nr:SPFH domain-containing protein [Flavobacterium caeni]SCZ01254.1 Membrane protease subunit, stomatin/prohibitin family, contains C-terminal Zn-ribbon domain [Flavobacterium caeni]
MALIDIVKYQSKEDDFIWKFPSSDLRIGTQVVVDPAQHAFFIKGGVIYDEFTTGTHTLTTANIPLLNKVINLPFGGDSPFQAEVWFVNLTTKLDNKWGTSTPILLEDPKYNIIVPVRAFGQYGFKISNPRIFLEKLTGNLPSYSAVKIQEYLKGKIISHLTSVISKKLIREDVSVLEINAHLEELSEFCKINIAEEFKNYGLELVTFYFLSINIPLDDPSLTKLRQAKALTASVKITGNELYQIDRNLDIMESAAKNESATGNFMGAGLGFALGSNIGNQINSPSSIKNIPPPLPVQYYLVIDNPLCGLI